jgi:hypothetical protein
VTLPETRGIRLAHVIQRQRSARNAEVEKGPLTLGIPNFHECNSTKQDNGFPKQSNQFHEKRESVPVMVTIKRMKAMCFVHSIPINLAVFDL